MSEYKRVVPVSGPPSYRVSRIGLWFIGLFVVFCFGTAVTVLSRPSNPDQLATTVFFSMLGGMFAAGALCLAFIAAYQFQAGRERDSGFTWQPAQYQNLDQIEPTTFVIIRSAGEEFLSDSELKRRKADARAWAAQHPDGS